MTKVASLLQSLSRVSLISICVLLILLVTLLDYFSGPDISTSIFYLVPISIATWFVNRRFGLALAFISATLWFITDFFSHEDLAGQVSFWNAVVRLGFFLIVVTSLAALRRSRQRQEDLMSFVVHDLRAPLGNMLTALDMLQTREVAPEPDNTWDELIKLGQASGKRMLILVNSLLDLSRLESGKLEVQREEVALGELFAESVAQVILTAEYKQVVIKSEIDPRVTAVSADPALTQRIIVNLLNNAIKFSPINGEIALRAMLSPANEVVLSVQDDGPGIPAEWQRRVFAKFGQVSGGKTGGSGLGLTFCKLAVEAQDGRIWLESEKGQGTILSFSLPGV